MPSILSPFKPDDGPYQSIGSSIRSLGQSIWGDEAKNEGLRQNALKLQRENSAHEAGADALRQGNAVETLAQGFRGGVSAPDTTGYIRGYYGNTKGADSPEFNNAAAGAGEPWQNTPYGLRETMANQRAMEQDRTDRFSPAIVGTDPITGQPIHGAIQGRTGETRQFGQPTGFNQPGAPPQQGAQGAGFRPVADTPPPGEDDGVNHEYFTNLQATNPAMAAHVAGILDGREPFPTLGQMRNNPLATATYNHVAQVEPGFDATKWYQRKKTSDYFSGSGGGALAQKSANQAIKHLYDMAGYSDNLHNREGLGVLTQPWNSLANQATAASGGTAPGQFNVSRKAAVDEIAKFFKGANLSDTEIHAWDSLFSDAQTSPQHKANMGAALQLYQHGLDALEEQRQAGMSPLAKGRVGPLISPETQGLIQRLQGWQHGQPLAGAQQAPAGPSTKLQYDQHPSGPPQPVVTPQSQAGPSPTGQMNGPPPPAVQFLQQHPETRQMFDQKYGAGASARILGQ